MAIEPAPAVTKPLENEYPSRRVCWMFSITWLIATRGCPAAASALVRVHSARISVSVLRVSRAKPVADQTTSRRVPYGT
jgi:hypothetical protein